MLLITWFLSNQLYHPRLALISNWLYEKNRNKEHYLTIRRYSGQAVGVVLGYPDHIRV